MDKLEQFLKNKYKKKNQYSRDEILAQIKTKLVNDQMQTDQEFKIGNKRKLNPMDISRILSFGIKSNLDGTKSGLTNNYTVDEKSGLEIYRSHQPPMELLMDQ